MKYSIEHDVRVVEVPVKDFRVILYDGKKKSMGPNRCNGGFFGNFVEKGDKFTLPVAHLIADYEATNEWTEHYCRQRGRIVGGKVYHDASTYANPFKGKQTATLVVVGGKASVLDLLTLPTVYDYAIAGIPVVRAGKAVEYIAAKGQGWDASSLYGTMHIFAGVKKGAASTLYIMALKTTRSNLLTSKEAYHKFKALGMWDVIKLDGGGSFYFNAAGNTVSTYENRRVCTILDFGENEGNPYAVPTSTLRAGSSNRSGVYWLQWELTDHGFPCELDGSFGPATLRQLKAYQQAAGLAVDGSCGPATRAALLKN